MLMINDYTELSLSSQLLKEIIVGVKLNHAPRVDLSFNEIC